MQLTPGTRLEPYEIVALIGAGGMGEVYQARDPRLGREVAIKLLAASPTDRDRVARFEQEARAAGTLNHPNIVVVYDVGVHEGRPYVVTELLAGETLRERLRHSPCPPAKAVDYAVQVAQGLAAAHERGIYHRDLKPENLFVTRDGHVKILDFGLAKLAASMPDVHSSGPTLPVTQVGSVLGTPGYMAPEQARGQVSDGRSDIFSLGAVLYEMLAGRKAFPGDTPVDALGAILRDEPPPLSESGRHIPPALAHIVQHCLEKSPTERFQSVTDLAFDLREVQRQWMASDATPPPPERRRPRFVSWRALALIALVVGAGVWFRVRLGGDAAPSFQQLTFQRGTVLSARSAPGADSVILSAAWEGRPTDVFQMQGDSPASRPLGYEGARLLAVSTQGDLALVLGHHYVGGERFAGTLARVPLVGGVPRELLEGVEEADWSPDGGELAVVRSSGAGGHSRLEYPIGTVLYETPGALRDVRVAPDGERVAFFDDASGLRASGAVTIVDREGRRKVLTPAWVSAHGLAWTPKGDEIWFAAAAEESTRTLRAVSLSGALRVVSQVPGSLTLHDIAPDGSVLLSRDEERHGIIARAPGETTDRELSWFDESAVGDVSADGRLLLFGDRGGVYLRGTNGSPAVHLGTGFADALSPDDGRFALITSEDTRRLFVVPTGPGESMQLPSHGIDSYAGARWLPDGQRVLFNGRGDGGELRAYVQALAGGAPRPVTPEGIWGRCLSHDGSVLAAVDSRGRILLQPLEGGAPKPARGAEAGDQPAGWTADGQSLWVFHRDQVPAPVYRLHLATGRREPWKRLCPADPTGVVSITRFVPVGDGGAYAYTYRRLRSELFRARGLR